MTDYQTACRTKAARETLYKDLSALASDLGATITRHDDTREITAEISLAGYRCSLWVNGNSRTDASVVCWNTEGARVFDQTFGGTIAGSVNEHHFAKATGVYLTTDALLTRIRLGFENIATYARDNMALVRALPDNIAFAAVRAAISAGEVQTASGKSEDLHRTIRAKFGGSGVNDKPVTFMLHIRHDGEPRAITEWEDYDRAVTREFAERLGVSRADFACVTQRATA